jgi:hypothetical protein
VGIELSVLLLMITFIGNVMVSLSCFLAKDAWPISSIIGNNNPELAVLGVYEPGSGLP